MSGRGTARTYGVSVAKPVPSPNAPVLDSAQLNYIEDMPSLLQAATQVEVMCKDEAEFIPRSVPHEQ